MTTPQSMRDATIRGASWATAAALFTKIAGLAVQWVFGWMLMPEDFELWGIATSLTIFTAALSDGGVLRLLKQQPDRYGELCGPATLVAAVANVLGGVLLLVVGWSSRSLYDSDAFMPLLAWLAVGMMIRTPASILKSKLAIDLRFGAVSGVEIASVVVRSTAMIWMATAGYGPLSFVVPPLIATIVESIVPVFLGAARGFRIWPIRRRTLVEVLAVSRWTVPTTAAGGLTRRGDYLVLGLVLPGVLGVYFFGYQLAASAIQLFTGGLQSVLLPTLAKLLRDPPRLAASFSRVFRMLAFVTCPAGALLFLAADPGIHLLWQGRWDAAIPVTEAVAASLVVQAVVPACAIAIETVGRWGIRMLLQLLDGVSLMAVTWVAATVPDADAGTIAWILVAQRVVFGAVFVVVSGRLIRCGGGRLVADLLRLAVPVGAAAAAAMFASSMLAIEDRYAMLAIRLAVFVPIWFAIAAIVARGEMSEVVEIARSRLGRRAS